MPNIQVKLRRGTTAQHAGFTGAEGEVTVDTDKETLVVHDNATAGGHELAKASDAYVHPNHTGDVTSTGDGATVIADSAVTHDKISTTDAVFKINTSDQVRIGGDLNDSALQSISQVGVTSSSASAVMTIESTGATNDGILVCTAQRDAIIQLKDASQSATDKGVYNISSADGKFSVGSVAAGGGGTDKQVIEFERKTLSAVDYLVPALPNLPAFADNSAATSGGLATNDVYKTSTGELRIVV
jgi:hypothetical protein